MSKNINVAILDDHQGILDGYMFRLSKESDLNIVSTLSYGEEIEPTLMNHPIDVLLLDVQVPTSPSNPNPFPILYLIPKLLQCHPHLNILIVSMHDQRTLIKSVMKAGASGYILKDDHDKIRDLAAIIRAVAHGEVHLSEKAYQKLTQQKDDDLNKPLSARQIEALSLCSAYPNASTAELAKTMGIAHSTLRNLLSAAYLKLNVSNKTAAVSKAYQLNLIPKNPKFEL